MNCRMWGVSRLTIAICDDPQPSEAMGSASDQVMGEAPGPARRTFKPC